MMEQALILLVLLPLTLGFVLPFFKQERPRSWFYLAGLLPAFVVSIVTFLRIPSHLSIALLDNYTIEFGLSHLSRFILIFINLFGLLVGLYSQGFPEVNRSRLYYSYLLWLVAFSNLALAAGDFITLIFGWGGALILLYAFLSMTSGASANKALSVVGFGDFSLMLGVAIYMSLSGTHRMPEGGLVVLNSFPAWLSFILMLLGAFAKAGCAPMHTWIPTAAETASAPVMAILPASLDKLLGIYLLARISVDFFILDPVARSILILIGGLTIVFAVMMALVQHDLRKLLSYHAISQVGYMVVGFGTGYMLGIAAGIFHMLNHSIYKSGLFLTGGSVGEKKHTFELEKLGGLAWYMPVTFACGLVFSLSISGVPPFNGFASKWMLYQAAISGMTARAPFFYRASCLFGLLAAMFGSVLTLASFIKFIHAVFLGQKSNPGSQAVTEVPLNRRICVSILAVLCLVLGLVPGWFLKTFINPWMAGEGYFIGTWNSLGAFLLILAGLALGIVFWQAGSSAKVRKEEGFFIGGEEPRPSPSFPGTEFYRTVEDMPGIKRFYRFIGFEPLDLFNLISSLLNTSAYLLYIFVDRVINVLTALPGRIILGLSWVFRAAHTGELDLYLAWSLVGLLVILGIFLLK